MAIKHIKGWLRFCSNTMPPYDKLMFKNSSRARNGFGILVKMHYSIALIMPRHEMAAFQAISTQRVKSGR